MGFKCWFKTRISTVGAKGVRGSLKDREDGGKSNRSNQQKATSGGRYSRREDQAQKFLLSCPTALSMTKRRNRSFLKEENSPSLNTRITHSNKTQIKTLRTFSSFKVVNVFGSMFFKCESIVLYFSKLGVKFVIKVKVMVYQYNFLFLKLLKGKKVIVLRKRIRKNENRA